MAGIQLRLIHSAAVTFALVLVGAAEEEAACRAAKEARPSGAVKAHRANALIQRRTAVDFAHKERKKQRSRFWPFDWWFGSSDDDEPALAPLIEDALGDVASLANASNGSRANASNSSRAGASRVEANASNASEAPPPPIEDAVGDVADNGSQANASNGSQASASRLEANASNASQAHSASALIRRRAAVAREKRERQRSWFWPFDWWFGRLEDANGDNATNASQNNASNGSQANASDGLEDDASNASETNKSEGQAHAANPSKSGGPHASTKHHWGADALKRLR